MKNVALDIFKNPFQWIKTVAHWGKLSKELHKVKEVTQENTFIYGNLGGLIDEFENELKGLYLKIFRLRGYAYYYNNLKDPEKIIFFFLFLKTFPTFKDFCYEVAPFTKENESAVRKKFEFMCTFETWLRSKPREKDFSSETDVEDLEKKLCLQLKEFDPEMMKEDDVRFLDNIPTFSYKDGKFYMRCSLEWDEKMQDRSLELAVDEKFLPDSKSSEDGFVTYEFTEKELETFFRKLGIFEIHLKNLCEKIKEVKK